MGGEEKRLLIRYLRISQEDEIEGESESIRSQRAIVEACRSRRPELADYQVVELVDDGYSGTNLQRPGLTQLLDWVRAQKVGCVMVKDLSRLGRNYKDVGYLLEQIFPFLGVRFIAVDDRYDSAEYNGGTGGIGVACKALLHDLYSRDISRKVKSSRASCIRRGGYFCSFAPYGYEKSKNAKHCLIIDEPAAETVRRVFEMACSGMGTTEIARVFNAEDIPTPLVYLRQKYPGCRISGAADNFWTNSTVLRLLKNGVYGGTAVSGVRPVACVGGKKRKKTAAQEHFALPDHHEAIVPPQQFQQAQDRIQHPGTKVDRQKMSPPIPFPILCGGCNRSLRRSNTKAPYRYCNTNHFQRSDHCVEGRLAESELIESVRLCLKCQATVLVDMEALLRCTHEYQKMPLSINQGQIKAIKSRINSLRQTKRGYFEHFCEGALDKEEFVVLGKKADVELRDAQLQLEKLEKQMAELSKKTCEIDTILQGMVNGLIGRIYVHGTGRIEIVFPQRDEFDG